MNTTQDKSPHTTRGCIGTDIALNRFYTHFAAKCFNRTMNAKRKQSKAKFGTLNLLAR